MDKHSFTSWLYYEATSARYALLTLYEQKDKLQYIDGPLLEKEYMDVVGNIEETVIKEEIECELLEMKKQIIQIAINRHETIDETAIDAEINAKREEKLTEAAGEIKVRDLVTLSVQQYDELQELYKEIVRDFHPQMHPELTEIQRQLFQKALDAYRHSDLDALKLIYEMLTNTNESGLKLDTMIDFSTKSEDNGIVTYDFGFTTDYGLAAEIYKSFRPLTEEAAIREEIARYRQITESVMKEIEEIRSNFPFTASEMLCDPAKIQEYQDSVSYRLHTATNQRKLLSDEIKKMIEGATAHG